jgi:hypothetical protein
MCTGEAPFRAPTTVAVLSRVCEEMPPDVRDFNRSIPGWFAEIIDKLHAKRPRDRFRTADQVARLLSQHLGHILSPDSVDLPRSLARPDSTSWRGWWVAAIVIAATVVILPLLVWLVVLLMPPPGGNIAQQQGGQGQPGQAGPGKAPVVPPAKADPFFQRLMAEVDDANVITRRDALLRLATMQPNDQRAQVVKKLIELSEANDPHTRRAAVTALGVWGSAGEVPALLKAMEHEDVFTRREALKVIGRFRDPQTLPALIRCFRDFHTRADADKALRELGAMAEKDVLEILKERDVFLKRDAIYVLTDIGGEASVPALKEVAAAGHVFLVQPAQTALTAIAGRKKQ